MADNSPILIGRDNLASPGAQTLLSRDANSTSTDPVFTVRTPVGGDGIHGNSTSGNGVRGISESNFGVMGRSTTNNGVVGQSTAGFGVSGTSGSSGVTGGGVEGISTGNGRVGVSGFSPNGGGVSGRSDSGIGVVGRSTTRTGVQGSSTSGNGVSGFSTSGIGVSGRAAPNSGKAGFFDGGITVVNGLKPFTIDHPLDPQNKYLVHTSVESSEMKNVYDGVARLDDDGAAWVELPEWFEALNGDVRYQLTAVGGSAPGLHVAEEVSENRFKIAGGEEGMKVCWQVTGTRKDPWAAANPFEVEQEKREEERGRYLDPVLYDAPEEQRVMIGPIAEAVEEEQRRREMEERQEEAPPEST